jgi:lysophospholipid acyltransferase (LPLAT)-like uncharacterized protein
LRDRSHKERALTWFVGLAGAALLTVIHRTVRWRNSGLLSDKDFWNSGDAKIFAFWHGRQLMMSFAKTDFQSNRDLSVLISAHRDGRMIAEVVRRLGIRSVAGSSSRGGADALRELRAIVSAGGHIAITPDGPRGPVFRSKAGVVFLASQLGIPIYPATCSFRRFWSFSSWDQMVLPKPWTRAVRTIGEPVHIPPNITRDRISHYTTMLDTALNQLQERADRELND